LPARQAFREALRKAQGGSAEAQCQVGQFYAEGPGVSRDLAEAVKWYRRAADQGNVAAQNQLGICLYRGKGVEYDPTEAVKWFRKAADQGNAEAELYLGAACMSGHGVPFDYGQGMMWFEKAAKDGDTNAQGLVLGMAYFRAAEEGDSAEARKDLEKCAHGGNPTAQTFMGIVFLESKDETAAASWFERAAEQQNAVAESLLATAYFNGRGVSESPRKAVFWARKAAEEGNADAQELLANCYQDGTGVRRNAAEAVNWFRQSAQRGNYDAQFELGEAYRDGDGVKKDCLQAYRWFDAAALQGNTNAIAARDQLSKAMTPEQLTQAGAVARARLSKFDPAFVQSGGSCVLSSYAIVANFFTGHPVREYFEGYCHHFGIAYTNAVDAEKKYARHFDAEYKKRNCLGYEVILDLHSNATEQCFIDARARFDPQLFRESAPHTRELEQALREREAVLNITMQIMSDAHSVTAFAEGDRLFVRDTGGRRGFHTVERLEDVGKLLDAVLYVAKQPAQKQQNF
jgi:TPR repeat protein